MTPSAHIPRLFVVQPAADLRTTYDDTAAERLRRHCPNGDMCGIPSSAAMISFLRSLVRNLCFYRRRA